MHANIVLFNMPKIFCLCKSWSGVSYIKSPVWLQKKRPVWTSGKFIIEREIHYLIISLLNRLRNGQCSSFRVWKIFLKNVDFATWFRLFSRTSNFDRFQFSSQFHCERAIYLLRKPWIRSIEKVFWKWKHLWHGRSIQTLVKVLLFH